MTMNDTWLKILSGQHAGAEVPLKDDLIKLGDDEGVDIMLSDELLKGASFSLQKKSSGYVLSQSSESLAWSVAHTQQNKVSGALYKAGDFIFALANDQAFFTDLDFSALAFEPYTVGGSSDDGSENEHYEENVNQHNSSQDDSEQISADQGTQLKSDEGRSEGESESENQLSKPADKERLEGETLDDEEFDDELIDDDVLDDEESVDGLDSNEMSVVGEALTRSREEAEDPAVLVNKGVLASVIVFVCVFTVIGWFFFSDSEEVVEEVTDHQCQQSLIAMMKRGGYEHIKWRLVDQVGAMASVDSKAKTPKSANGTHMYSVSGYLKNQSVLTRLQTDLADFPCQIITTNIYFHSDVIDDIRGFLPTEMTETVQIKPTSVEGTYAVSGYAGNGAKWFIAKNRMLQDINGLNSIIDEVSTADTHLQRLRTMLNKSELNGYIHLKVVDDKIVTNMVFDPEKMRIWQKFESEYRAQYPYMPEVVMDSVNITQLGITGVTLGKYPHIVLENGEKFSQGSTLPNGSVLQAIDQDGVVLSTIHGEIRYPFFRLQGK